MIQNFLIRLIGKPTIQINTPNYIIEGVPTEINVKVDRGVLQWIKVGNNTRRISAYASFSVMVYQEVIIEVYSYSLLHKTSAKTSLRASVYSSEMFKKINTESIKVTLVPTEQQRINLMSKPLFKKQKIKHTNKFPILKIKSLKNEPRLL